MFSFLQKKMSTIFQSNILKTDGSKNVLQWRKKLFILLKKNKTKFIDFFNLLLKTTAIKKRSKTSTENEKKKSC